MMESRQPYDLEERTFRFAKRTRVFVKTAPRTVCNQVDVRQLVRSSGSIGANYIEANEALSKKDRLVHMKIIRKEAKETIYWLRLLDAEAQSLERDPLLKEAGELLSIFSSIVRKLDDNFPPAQRLFRPLTPQILALIL